MENARWKELIELCEKYGLTPAHIAHYTRVMHVMSDDADIELRKLLSKWHEEDDESR